MTTFMSTMLTPPRTDASLPDMSTPRTRVPYQEAARQLLRDTVLDTTRELLAATPWNEITMADIARESGMSRQTLYKEFSSRQGLATAYLLRLVDAFLSGVRHQVETHENDARGAIESALAGFFAEGVLDPMVLNIVGDRPQHDLLSLVTTDGTPILDHATEELCRIFMDSWANLSRHDGEIFGATVVRLAISHLTLNVGNPDRVASDLADLFAPFLEQAVARSSGR